MTDHIASFRRVVFGFERSAPDRATLRFAADFARLLQLDLFALFSENPNLATLASHPLVREYRVLAQQWRSIEGRSMRGDLESCASIAKQIFEEEARATGGSHSFKIVRATTIDAMKSVSSTSDIVMLAEPRTPTDRAIQPFSDIVAAAISTPAAVLVVPNSITRKHGPILAIGETRQDPSVASAATIAAAANERLEFMSANDPSLRMLWQPPNWPGERMVVMTRGVGETLTPLSVASRRNVPVLVLGHGKLAGAGTQRNTARETRSNGDFHESSN